MQRCDINIILGHSKETHEPSLNPTYPGCSAVIGRNVIAVHQQRQSSLNPTYPGCSAVIHRFVNVPR